ncbi:uncharacterized protein [Watersipora subatra]|uniref:uncharacterized protein n=1 Tax=Watersipora subatra TaxID=2589382 RepID=UPI00355C235F
MDVENRRNPTSFLPDKSKSIMSTSDTTKSEPSIVEQLAACLTATFRSSHKSVESSAFEGNVLEFNDWEVDLDSYLRAEHIKGSYRLQKPTILKLELQGAVTATRLVNALRKELDKEAFWSESQIVLGYISNDVRKFHLYMANRVALDELVNLTCGQVSALHWSPMRQKFISANPIMEMEPTKDTRFKNPKWTPILIIAQILVFALTLTFNYLSSGGTDTSGIYMNRTGDIANKYVTKLSLSGWTFTIWIFIYIWQSIHCIYCLTLICRKNKDGVPLYRQPGHIHFSFYIVYMLNNAFNIAWVFIFDRELLELSVIFICLITFTLYICGVIVCKYLYEAGSYLSSTGNYKDIWLTRLITLNGVAFYGTWCTLASLLNFSIVLQYRATLDADTCAWVIVGIITFELVVWFVLETFVFDKHLRYCFSQYIVLVVALCGLLTRNYDPSAPAPYYIYAIVLLGISVFLGLVKVIVMFVKGYKYPITY